MGKFSRIIANYIIEIVYVSCYLHIFRWEFCRAFPVIGRTSDRLFVASMDGVFPFLLFPVTRARRGINKLFSSTQKITEIFNFNSIIMHLNFLSCLCSAEALLLITMMSVEEIFREVGESV